MEKLKHIKNKVNCKCLICITNRGRNLINGLRLLTSPLLNISQLARKLGISRGYLNLIAKGERPLPDAMRERIEQIITEEFKLTP